MALEKKQPLPCYESIEKIICFDPTFPHDKETKRSIRKKIPGYIYQKKFSTPFPLEEATLFFSVDKLSRKHLECITEFVNIYQSLHLSSQTPVDHSKIRQFINDHRFAIAAFKFQGRIDFIQLINNKLKNIPESGVSYYQKNTYKYFFSEKP